jgi:hypothetical protein
MATAFPTNDEDPMTKTITTTLLLLAFQHQAQADSEAAKAEALFDQGKQLMADGKILEACAAFDSSQQLGPAVTTVLNQASCREKAHQFATAWGLFVDAERQLRNATDEESATFRRVAGERAAKLQPILSTVTIEVPESSRLPGLAVARGSTAISVGEWNRPMPIDGGSYTITASAPGYESWHVTVAIGAELDVKRVKVPVLKKQQFKAVAVAKPSMARGPFVLAGSALVLGGAALGVDLWARGTYRDSQREADNGRQQDLWKSAKTQRYFAQGFAVASVATAGLAVWWFVRDRRERKRFEVAPMAGHTTAGLSIGGSW